MAEKRGIMRTLKEKSALSRLYGISGSYYNKGLARAKVHDLTGAAYMLRKSLEINKKNIDARNLLGLVLLEMGEPAAALSEWIISKHFQHKDNEADRYMDIIQSNPTRLDELNQAVKKYNMALEAARQGNDDLAVLQLKKVISINGKFIKALLLLSLIYIRNKEYDKAVRLLNNVLKHDTANITALSYLEEIRRLSGNAQIDTLRSKRQVLKADSSIAEKSRQNPSYSEDKPNVMAWVNWFLGIALGIAITFVLIVPTIKKNLREEYDKEKLDYASELNVQLAAMASKDSEIKVLKFQVEDLTSQLKSTEIIQYNTTLYDTLLSSLKDYLDLKQSQEEYTKETVLAMAEKLREIESADFSSDAANTLLDMMKNEFYPGAAEYALADGKELFNSGKYDEAKEILLASYEYNSDSDSVLYYLGKVYQAENEYETAISYYNMVIENYPSSSLAGYAKIRIGEME